MIEAMKVLHYLALAAGLGMSSANVLLGLRMARHGDAAVRGELAALQRLFGLIGLNAVLVLWASGAALYFMIYGGEAPPGAWFHAKIGFAVLLTVTVLFLRMMLWRAASYGMPPSPLAMRWGGRIVPLLAVVAVICAVAAFR